MPSQEDYLDDLLKNMMADDTQETSGQEDVSEIGSDVIQGSEDIPDIDSDVMQESEDIPDIDPDVMQESEDISDINLDAILESMDISEMDLETMQEPEDVPEIDLDAMLESMDIHDADSDTMQEPVDGLDDISAQYKEDAESDLEAAMDGESALTLDDLLQQNREVEDSADGPVASTPELVPDLETVSAMSEEEINRFLESGLEETISDSAIEQSDDEDLVKFLDDADDGDLQEIQQLLKKSDNNEAVDEAITDLLQEDSEQGEALQELLTADDSPEQLSPRAQKALEKKRMRQEKAEARKAAKAAAKEAKAAAKAAKAAEKTQTAAAVGIPMADEALQPEETLDESFDASTESLFDTDLLDSIVSEADAVDSGKMSDVAHMADEAEADLNEPSELFGGEDLLGDLDFLGGGESTSESTGESDGIYELNDSNVHGNTGSDDGVDSLGFDMDNLFDNLGTESNLEDESGSGDDLSGFPDFVPLDGDDADSLISEIQGERKEKKNLFARLFEFLTDEAEEEENEGLQLSDENREILNDLDNEKTKGKKRKKKAKKVAPAQEGEENAEESQDGKPQKEKKEKKPKKEKPVKEKAVAAESKSSDKKLSLKKVMPVLLVCASLAVLILVFSNASVDFTDKQNARAAYYAGDYQTCYQNLYGKELDETEQIMFGKSRSILYIRLWIREYEMFIEEGSEVEALDSLIQTVEEYPSLYAYAAQWNAETEVAAGYENVLNILYSNYGLTESQALEIAGVRSDLEYTKMVVDIVSGKPFGSWNEPEPTEQPEIKAEAEPQPMQDVLPEESELQDNGVVLY